jgi:hypothetical protein
MQDLTAKRTLVKSPPELWNELSEVERLARHLDAFGEIKITKLEPEHTVAWEGEGASGTVSIEPSGWGTKVTLTAQVEQAAAEPNPPGTAPPETAAAKEEPPSRAAAPPEPEPPEPELEPELELELEAVSECATPAAEEATIDHSATIMSAERERTREREMEHPLSWRVYPIAQPNGKPARRAGAEFSHRTLYQG